MKKIIALTVLFLMAYINPAAAQDCSKLDKIVKDYLIADDKGNAFVSDGQTYTAFLDNEKAEFNTTLYGGSYYRIAASAGTKDDYVIFTVIDQEDNVLFTNKDQKNAPFWDFKVENTIPVKVQTELDTDKKITGCIVMMIGFLK